MDRLAIRLLGPLEIKLNGKPMSGLESDKVRALLVFLAIAGPRPHRREKLAALLWPNWPERSARANLRRALANLRKALGDCNAAQPFLLVTRQTIQFNPDSNAWVDAIVLDDLLGGGFPQQPDRLHKPPTDPRTFRRLQDAVELYCGDFLEGFSLADSPAFDEWAMFQQEQLHRQVVEALSALGNWYESRGEWEQALRSARRQVELEPWRESGHQQVMRLLAHCGQRAAALVQYRVCRQVLADELGIAPQRETIQLFEQIRDGAPESVAIALARPQEPAVVQRTETPVEDDQEERPIAPPFVAREGELARLEHLLERAIGGQGQVVFITGGAGRGKTALLGEFARRATETHSELLVAGGKCDAYLGLGNPYQPFRDVFAMLTGDAHAQCRAAINGQDAALRLKKAFPLVVQTLLQRGSHVFPALLSGRALLSRASEAVPPSAPWLRRLREQVAAQQSRVEAPEQSRLFPQVVNVLQYLAEAHPLLLNLEDLQWIDTASACLLFHLGRRLGDSRIMVAGAYRPEELASGHLAPPSSQSVSGELQRHPLEKVLGEFKRRFGDVWIDLAAVDESEARRFVDALLDSEPHRLQESFRDSLFRRTGGHPLFAIEMLQAMQARGDLLRDDAGRWTEGPVLDWKTLPARVEGVIEERIARLDDGLRKILKVASVDGEEFTAAVLAEVLAEDEQQLVRRLSEELEKTHRLVGELGVRTVGARQTVRYRFAHVLVRQYLYDRLGEGRRTLLHREIAGILEVLHEGSPEEFAPQLA